MFIKSFDWEVGDTVVSNTNKFNFTKGKTYEVFNEGIHEDIFVIRDDLGYLVDISDTWFKPKSA